MIPVNDLSNFTFAFALFLSLIFDQTHLKLYGGLLAVCTNGSYGILFGCCFCFGEGDEDDELATDEPDE